MPAALELPTGVPLVLVDGFASARVRVQSSKGREFGLTETERRRILSHPWISDAGWDSEQGTYFEVTAENIRALAQRVTAAKQWAEQTLAPRVKCRPAKPQSNRKQRRRGS